MSGTMMGGTAAAAIRPAQPNRLHNLSDAQLADEHRAQGFAKRRAEETISAVEAELERRKLTEVKGRLAMTTRQEDPHGRVDLRRLRRERPDICREYAQEGSSVWWRSRTLRPDERP